MALLDPARRKELEANADAHLKKQDAALQKLKSKARPYSVEQEELNEAFREMIRNAGRVDNLVAYAEDGDQDDMMEYWDSIEDPQAVLDIMNGTGAQLPGTLAEFMSQRMAVRADQVRGTVTSMSDPNRSMDMRLIRAQMEAEGSDSITRKDLGRVSTLAEYDQLVGEVAAVLHTVEGLRDPENRLKLKNSQLKQVASLVKGLDDNLSQARTYLDKLMREGTETTALEAPLRELLDSHQATNLLDPEPEVSTESLLQLSLDSNAFMTRVREGQPAAKEAVRTVNAIAALLKESNSPAKHHQFASAVRNVLRQQLTENNGTVPDALKTALRDPAFQRFGVFSDALARADIDDLVKNGVDLRAATNGQYADVEWQNAPAISPDLVTDDRPDGGVEYADKGFAQALGTVTPNVASALNSMFAAMGGGIRRTRTSIAEAQHREGARWRTTLGRTKSEGADTRGYEDIEGVYSKMSNTVVVSDLRVVKDSMASPTHVVVHELGHALDSMLGETLNEGGWFTNLDPEFLKFHTKLKDDAKFGRSPEQSLLNWYFRSSDEGAAEHNGSSGAKEVFAEGYASYVYGRGLFEENAGVGGAITRDTYYALIARNLIGTKGRDFVVDGHLTRDQLRTREVAMGKGIYEYFDRLETERLPKMMSTPAVIPVESEFREFLLAPALGAPPSTPQQQVPTPSQLKTASSHKSTKHGTFEMEHIKRGTPEWDAKIAEIKAHSPKAKMPTDDAIYVTFNPSYKEQGATLIWKAVVPNRSDLDYGFSDEHKATQLAAKFQRQKIVHEGLGKVRIQAEGEAMFDETAAAVLALIETGARVGSSASAGTTDRKTGKKVTTYGTNTMLKKHVFFPSPNLMRFKYQGKANKANVYETRNPVLIAAVKQLLEGKGPSDQVFANTTADRTIEYLRAVTGIEDIINHDTRTDYATSMAHDLVAKVPRSKMPKNEAALKRLKGEIAKKVGLAINDTAAVAKESYISPSVWIPLEDSAGVVHEFEVSPPYGLTEGEVVQSIGGPAVGGPPAPAPAAPAAPVTSAAEPAPEEPAEPEPEADPADESPEAQTYQMDTSDAARADRDRWYESFTWPDPPVIAGPEPESEDVDVEEE